MIAQILDAVKAIWASLRQVGGSSRMGGAAVAWCTCVSAPALGEDYGRKFLDELRTRGYFDMAVEYLERIPASRPISDEFRDVLLYEQGVTLLKSGLLQRDFRMREEQLNSAYDKFGQFLKEHSGHALAATARMQRGKIQIERSQLRRARSESSSTEPSAAKRLHAEAAQLLDEARTVFEETEASLRQRLEPVPRQLDPNKDQKLIQDRSQLRSDYVLAKFLTGLVLFEKSAILPEDSQEREKTLRDAFAIFQTVAEKYRRRIWGIEAVYYEGQCQQLLGKPKDALGFYMELLEQDAAEPELRRIRTKSLAQAIECWLHTDIKNYDAAIEQGSAWLKEERPIEQRDLEWMSFRLALAKAYQAKAQTESGAARQELEIEARRLANRVASVPSPVQKPAQELLMALGQMPERVADEPLPTTFATAVEAARQIRERHQVASATVQLVRQRIADVKGESERKELQSKVEAAELEQSRLRQAEIDMLRTCLALAEQEELPLDKLHDIRFQLCYFYYLSNDDYRAITLGEFLANRYPDATGSRQSARIALASLVRLHAANPQRAAPWVARILRLAEFIMKRWPGSEEADVALQALITFSIQNRDFREAEKYLAMIPPDSTKLGDAELTTGQALWSEYVNIRGRQSATEPAGSPELTQLKERAIGLLRRGVERKRSNEATPSLVYAILSLAQSHVDAEQFAQAIELLDDEQYGPHHLARADHPLVQGKGIREQAFSLAIQAYLGDSANSTDPEARIRQAMEDLESLRHLVERSPAGKQAMASEYVNLASQLQARIEHASPTAKLAISRGFESLLDRVAHTSTDRQVLIWSAESFAKLGRASADAHGKLNTAGQRLLGRTQQIYLQLLQAPDLDAESRKSLHLRLAVTLRDLRQFEQAIDTLVELLKRNETQVHVQMETARTFQMWGDSGAKDAYLKAIAGDRTVPATRQNLVWGWGKLSQLLGRDPKFRDLFFESRYHLAVCRFRYALMMPKPDRTKTLKMAETDVVFTARLYPELGGEQRRQQFDQLLKQVQQSLGEQPVGLAIP